MYYFQFYLKNFSDKIDSSQKYILRVNVNIKIELLFLDIVDLMNRRNLTVKEFNTYLSNMYVTILIFSSYN